MYNMYNDKFAQNFENHVIKVHNQNTKKFCGDKEQTLLIMKLINEFITMNKNNIIIHGTRSVNFQLPPGEKILNDEQLLSTDFDTFSKTPLQNALDIVVFFKKNGIESQIKVLPLAYTILIDKIGYIDFGYISPELFDIMPTKTDNNGIKYVDMLYLKIRLLHQISLPIDSYRWKKIFYQLKVFDRIKYKNINANNRVNKNANSNENGNIENIKNLIQNYVVGNKKIIITGHLAFYLYANENKYKPDLNYIELLVNKPKKHIKNIIQLIGNKNIEIIKYNDPILQHVFYCICKNNKPIVFLHDISNECITYVKNGNNFYTKMFYLEAHYNTKILLDKVYNCYNDENVSKKCLFELSKIMPDYDFSIKCKWTKSRPLYMKCQKNFMTKKRFHSNGNDITKLIKPNFEILKIINQKIKINEL